MKITVTKDFRKFKKGDEFVLDLKPGEITFLVGPNGCGKSTLMFALRHKLDSFAQLDNKNTENMKSLDLTTRYLGISPNVTIEEFDFDKTFFRDTIVDNPVSFMNAATAWGLVAGGGLADSNKSAGQKNVNAQCRMVANIINMIGARSDERIPIG